MNRTRISAFLFVLTFLSLQPVGASADEVRIISLGELRATIDAGEKILLLNPEPELLFNEGHIPGSVNIPLKDVPGNAGLTADRGTMIVVYCRGPGSMLGKQAGEAVSRMGHPRVRWFRGGAAAWAAAGYALEYRNALPRIPVTGINAGQLQESLSEVVILDIRTPVLQDLGWIVGSHKMPLEDLTEKYMDLPKGRKIVVVDQAGSQTIVAARFLEQKGYVVQGLVGGMASWVNDGFPVEK